MATDDEVCVVGWLYATQFLMLAKSFINLQRTKRSRRFWVRKLFQGRSQYGFCNTLIPQLRLNDQTFFFQFMRMTPKMFDKLLGILGPTIQKKDTRFRKAISPSDRLSITLRFLASGETYRSLSFAFRVGRSTISVIVKETSEAIWNSLKTKYVAMPQTPEDWKEVAKGFEVKWQLPHCCGSIDGKHVWLECPDNTGTLNFNYKGTFSKVLLAVSDSQYKFLMVDFGHYGGESDGGIFQKCLFGQKLLRNELNLPPAEKLPFSNELFPYYFAGDEAFPLRSNLMRPYPRRSNFSHNQRIYNYRLSRGRRVIENAFGILSARFRIFKRPLNYHVDAVRNIVSAALALHNFLLTETADVYCPNGYADYEDENHDVVAGRWRQETQIEGVERVGSNMYSKDAKVLRDTLSKYFINEGKVPWQEGMVYRGLPQTN